MGLKNWHCKEIRELLLAYNFAEKKDREGSRRSYLSPDKKRLVVLHWHDKKVKGFDVMRPIIQNSGIPEKNWTKSKVELRKIKKVYRNKTC
jgi:hypothetical protein